MRQLFCIHRWFRNDAYYPVLTIEYDDTKFAIDLCVKCGKVKGAILKKGE